MGAFPACFLAIVVFLCLTPARAEQTVPSDSLAKFFPENAAYTLYLREQIAKAETKLNLVCPKETQAQPCRMIDDISSVPPGSAGLTLYVTGAKAADLSRQAAEGKLTQATVRTVLQEKAIGLLPEVVERGTASVAVNAISLPAIAKTGRAAAVVGAVLMTYATYQYFFPAAEPEKKK